MRSRNLGGVIVVVPVANCTGTEGSWLVGGCLILWPHGEERQGAELHRRTVAVMTSEHENRASAWYDNSQRHWLLDNKQRWCYE